MKRSTVKLARSTAHIQRTLPVMALVSAILRIKARWSRAEQTKLKLRA
jgi:hypothetical protein